MSEQPPIGRRARKTRETRQRIADVALALFLKQGFEETTLDAIAEAADISRRTFFHYYASKEAIVEALDDDIYDVFLGALNETPQNLSPLQRVHMALRAVISRYSSEEAKALHELMYSTDGLRARKQASYARQEKALFAALSKISPEPGRDRGLGMVAIIGIGAMRIAVDRWREKPGKLSLVEELDRAFNEFQHEIKDHDS